jgi:hypothetical protein
MTIRSTGRGPVDRQIHLIERGAEVKQDNLIFEYCALLDYYAVGIRCVITGSIFLFWTTYYENREKLYVIHF